MRSRPRILVFAWFYPPYLAAGSSRTGQLVKYLVRAGAEVDVVTARPKDLPELSDIETGARIHYADYLDLNALPARLIGRSTLRDEGYRLARLGRFAFAGRAYKQLVHFPDAQAGWIGGALRTAERLGAVDVVLSTSSPPSAHLAAAMYRRKHKTPWVAEYRDPWTGNPTFRRWWPAREVERRIERMVSREASAITAITPGLRAELERRYDRPVVHVPNGFDPDDFRGAPPAAVREVLHVGTVYTNYDLAGFLAGVKAARSDLKVAFLGRNLADLPEHLAAADAEVRARIELRGPVRRSAAMAATRSAAANLLFFWRHDRALAEVYVPQKLYEYLAAGRPVIAYGDDRGDAADILKASGLGVFARTPAELAAILTAEVPERAPQIAEIERYSYASIARTYLEILDGARIARR